MQKSSYIGYIKDYEGATLMHVSISDDIIGFKCIFGGFRLFVIVLFFISSLYRCRVSLRCEVLVVFSDVYVLWSSISNLPIIRPISAMFLANLIAVPSSYTCFYCSFLPCAYTQIVGKLFQISLSILYHYPFSRALCRVQCFLFFCYCNCYGQV